MRIAYLSHFYPPLHNAGIEQATHSMARGMLNAGHQVRVLCVGRWTTGDRYWQGYDDDEWQGVPIRRLNVNWTKAAYPSQYLYNNPVMAEQIYTFLTEFAPDVVHVTSMYTLSTHAIRVAKTMNLPIIFTLSDFWPICPRHTLLRYGNDTCDGLVSATTCQDCMMSESKLYQSLKKVIPQQVLSPVISEVIRHPSLGKHVPGIRGWGVDIEERRNTIYDAMKYVDIALAPSIFIRDTILKVGIPLDIKISHYGNDLDWVANYSLRQRDDRLHIGYLGQIHPMKGIHILIEAFQQCRFDEHVHLYIYGKFERESPYVQSLFDLAAGNPNIHFEGAYLRNELPLVLGNIDLLVVPSNWPEVAGLVVQEAFAAKIPVIASRIGGLPEFVQEGRGGQLFDPSRPEELAQILTQIANGGETTLSKMRAEIPKVRTSQDEVIDMIHLYTELKEKYQT